MKFLSYFYLPFCSQVQKLPEELGSLQCLEELDINCTGINHLPRSIFLLKYLRIVGSESLLQSCALATATEIQTSETETFTQALDNTGTETKTGLRNQFTENYCNRWCWSVVMALVVALLVMQVVIQVKVWKKKVKFLSFSQLASTERSRIVHVTLWYSIWEWMLCWMFTCSRTCIRVRLYGMVGFLMCNTTCQGQVSREMFWSEENSNNYGNTMFLLSEITHKWEN